MAPQMGQVFHRLLDRECRWVQKMEQQMVHRRRRRNLRLLWVDSRGWQMAYRWGTETEPATERVYRHLVYRDCRWVQKMEPQTVLRRHDPHRSVCW